MTSTFGNFWIGRIIDGQEDMGRLCEIRKSLLGWVSDLNSSFGSEHTLMVLGSGVCISIMAMDGLSRTMFECLYDVKNSRSRYLAIGWHQLPCYRSTWQIGSQVAYSSQKAMILDCQSRRFCSAGIPTYIIRKPVIFQSVNILLGYWSRLRLDLVGDAMEVSKGEHLQQTS
jgi:hypothetical protein